MEGMLLGVIVFLLGIQTGNQIYINRIVQKNNVEIQSLKTACDIRHGKPGSS